MIPTLVASLLLLALVTPVHAVPACWTLTPLGGPGPFATFTEGHGCRPDAFVLEGQDNVGNVYLELSAHSLAYIGSPGPESVSPWSAHEFLRVMFYTGPAHLVNPDVFVVQWLIGSDLDPGWARQQHAAGMWTFPGDDWPAPLEHSPEPTSLLLLGTGLLLIGWRVRRGRP